MASGEGGKLTQKVLYFSSKQKKRRPYDRPNKSNISNPKNAVNAKQAVRCVNLPFA